MARRKEQSALPDPASLSYEQAIAEIESIIEVISGGDVGLEESLRQVERGDALLRRCDGILRDAEQKIEQLDRSRLARLDESQRARDASDGVGGGVGEAADDGAGDER